MNRAAKTLELLKHGGTALSVQQAFICTTPSKWISEARRLAEKMQLRWDESRVKCSDGRNIKYYRVCGG